MTIRIELKPDEEGALRERARLAGQDPVQYAQEVIRDHIGQEEDARKAQPTLEDLMDHEYIGCSSTGRRSPDPPGIVH